MIQLVKERDGRIYRDDEREVSLRIPRNWEASLCTGKRLPGLSEDEIEKKICGLPAGRALRDIAREKGAQTACILISDATRAVPTSILAKYVVSELQAGGIGLDNITFFVAIGVHRPATEQEFREMLGELYGKVHIENHTPFCRENLIYLGDTRRGTPVRVNRRACECDLHVQIGKVEPHEFAGFSGGRKSVLPGIAGEETILVNHRPEMILDEKASTGVLKGNPVHEDMEEAAELFGVDFAVNCILNQDLEIADVFAGGLKECHSTAVEYVRDRLFVEVKKTDVIITTPGEPLDIDFYQAVKALIALTEIMDEVPCVVLYCNCREGINSADMLSAFQKSDDLEEVVRYVTENYKIQMDHVLLLSKILRKKVKVYVVCPNIEDKNIEDMFMIPCASLQAAVEKASEYLKKDTLRLLFYPYPQTGLPVSGQSPR